MGKDAWELTPFFGATAAGMDFIGTRMGRHAGLSPGQWPQQIEADLIKTAMVSLDRIFRRRNMKIHIVIMIHDALWVEALHDEESEVKRLVRKMMTTAGKLDVPLEIDSE